jgi:hypothetical protein
VVPTIASDSANLRVQSDEPVVEQSDTTGFKQRAVLHPGGMPAALIGLVSPGLRPPMRESK